ncbi:BDN_1c_G0035870.mRNA.1.CDS.1 [Saccharomyces cerevisiae]|nr:BDN_1c_G0035870.mRNA.1.CDS.1 [Saccharomyces cerevisiae]CAI7209222.1 BDN_1c_G0035870.mRNA.1.CDS.1 [Saccharomyces cerevisiae]
MFFLCLVLLRGDIYSHIRTEFYKVRTLNGVVKRRKKKMLSDLPSLQPPRFTRKRSCPSEFIVNISSNVNVE